MTEQDELGKVNWKRRQLLKLGLGAGLGVTGAAIALKNFWKTDSDAMVHVPPLAKDMWKGDPATNPMRVLRDFDYGMVKQVD
ncbi:MAG TPA: copper oxidase, partial [Microcoleaceae cyanobacterium]